MSQTGSPYASGGKGGRSAAAPPWQAQYVLGGGGSAAAASPAMSSSNGSSVGPGSPASYSSQNRARTPAHASPTSPPAPHAGSTPSRATAQQQRRRSSSPTKGGGGGGVGPYSLEPMSEAAYRLACARSTEHREQELSWYWHLYRLRTAKGAIDAKKPFSMSVRRDPAAAARHGKAKTEAVFRQAEIAAANTALVSRIKGQRSAYASHFSAEQQSAASSPLVREHRLRAEEFDARAGTSTARTGGSSGLFFGSRASRNEQRKIEADNAALLRSLKRINKAPGPYNSEKVAAEISQHEHLVRRRLPRVMHAHPKHLLKSSASAAELSVPPIHYSVIAARATSPSRGGGGGGGGTGGFASTLNSPPRRLASPLIPSASREGHWREYAAARGLTPSSSSPALQASSPPSARSNGGNDASSSPGHGPQRSNTSSARRNRGKIDSLTMEGLLDAVAGMDVRGDDVDDGEHPQHQQSQQQRQSRPSSSRPRSAKHNPHLESLPSSYAATAAAAAASSSFAALPRLEPLEQKAALSRTRATVSGRACTVVAEVAQDTAPGSPPKTLQFTCYPDVDGDGDASSTSVPPASMALLVSLSSLQQILPSSLSGMVQSPYEDFTTLLYAIAPRFYLRSCDRARAGDEAHTEEFGMHLEPGWTPPPTLRPASGQQKAPSRPASAAQQKASSRPPSAAATSAPIAAAMSPVSSRARPSSGAAVAASPDVAAAEPALAPAEPQPEAEAEPVAEPEVEVDAEAAVDADADAGAEYYEPEAADTVAAPTASEPDAADYEQAEFEAGDNGAAAEEASADDFPVSSQPDDDADAYDADEPTADAPADAAVAADEEVIINRHRNF